MVRLTDRPDMTIDVYRGRKTKKKTTTKLSVGLAAHRILDTAYEKWNHLLFLLHYPSLICVEVSPKGTFIH